MPDRLSPLDVSFLYLEEPTTAMHVGSVMIFDPAENGYDYARLVRHVAARIAYVPRYRQRVRWVPGHLANPVWVDDEDFDINYHVRRSALPRPGTRTQLEELVARLQARRLDRSRPLWELVLVEGLADGRFAIVTKVHQALVDGINAVDLGQVVLDDAARAPTPPPQTWHPASEPSVVELVVGALADSVRRPQQVVETLRSGIGDFRQSATKAVEALGGLALAARTAARPTPRTPLNREITAHRRYFMIETDLEEYRRIRNHYNAGPRRRRGRVVGPRVGRGLVARAGTEGNDQGKAARAGAGADAAAFLDPAARALAEATLPIAPEAARKAREAAPEVAPASADGGRATPTLPAALPAVTISVNDVVLATLAGGLRSWLLTRGEAVKPGSLVRALVPMSVRVADGSQAGAIGSRVASLLVDLPTGEPSPIVRLHQVAYQTKAHREAGQAVDAPVIAGIAGFAPPTIHSLGARVASGLSRRLFNLVVTNVPGPQLPLYLAGSRMLATYPVIPLARGQALSVGLTSYDGGVYYGLNGDRDAMPDLDVLGQCILDALAEMRESIR